MSVENSLLDLIQITISNLLQDFMEDNDLEYVEIDVAKEIDQPIDVNQYSEE